MAKLQSLKKGQKFMMEGHVYRVADRANDSAICRDVKTRQEFCFIGNYDVR